MSCFPSNQEEREIVIEGYSSRMVQLAKRALQTSLALPPPGAGAPPALQQAAIASTSDCEARGAAVAARRNSQLLLSSTAAPPPLRDEEAVSSTTECEAVAAVSTLSDTGNVHQGNVFCSVGDP